MWVSGGGGGGGEGGGEGERSVVGRSYHTLKGPLQTHSMMSGLSVVVHRSDPTTWRGRRAYHLTGGCYKVTSVKLSNVKVELSFDHKMLLVLSDLKKVNIQ